MSFLPTTDSTRVSILSKRLGSVYRSDPIVDFDQPFYDQVLSRTSRKKLKRPVSFVNFMQKSFLHLKPNINIEKFKLRINDNNGISNKRNEGSNCFSIDHNNVKELVLKFEKDKHRWRDNRKFYCLPKIITPRSIVVLDISGFDFNFEDLILNLTLGEDFLAWERWIRRLGMMALFISKTVKLLVEDSCWD